VTTPTITGLRLTTVARDQVLTALTTGAAPTPPDTDNIDGAGAAPTWWMIAERPGDGYTVGRLAPGDSWHFADTFGAPARFDPSTFMHLRIFTSGTECLVVGVDTPAVWRTAITTEPNTPTTPRIRRVLLEQSNRPSVAAYPQNSPAVTVIVDPATGRRTVVPEPRSSTAPLTLTIREHFAADPRTGAVRVAAVCFDHYTA